jgi:nifR3 family TIM-barrel protein
MRDLDHAMSLVEATVAAAIVPVTLKMRLGWDHGSLNAPELARRAEAAGVAMITVHGRTRCQFYGGRADWAAIARVREAISIPLVANGDGQTADDARAMMAASGADAVMIGRGAYGRPWWPGVIANRLEAGSGIAEPTLDEEGEIVRGHHRAMLEFHGAHHGNRLARKHVGWVIGRLSERGLLSADGDRAWRQRLLQTADNRSVADGLGELYAAARQQEARAA